MKKFSLLALAAAGLLFGACSEKDAVVNETDATNPYGLIEGESSWISIGISMPGDVVTRGITRANEDLTDGDASEFTVYSGTLYLFKGANEDAATFFGSYPINDPAFNKEAGDNVPPENSLGTSPDGFGEITSTSSTKIVQEIDNPSLGVNDKLFAYVILNDKDNDTKIAATVNSTTGAQFKQLQLKAIGIADESKGYGSIFTKTESDKTTGGLVMTNVPVADDMGGDKNPSIAPAKISTFTVIDKNAIYKTKAEAQAATAACIYVERAAVKVEVKLANDFGIQLDGETAITSIDASDVKWALGNVNYGGSSTDAQGYFNTRQFDTNWLPYNNQQAPSYLKYRMVGRTPFYAAGHNNPLYRTYFGKDPNYTGTGTIPYNANTGLLYAQLPTDLYTLAPSTDANPVVTYTYENTFDENSQIYRNTTYVGVKVKIADDAFYTIEGQPNTKLTNLNDIKAVVETRLRDAINTRKTAIETAINADLAKPKKSVDNTSTRTISDGITNVTFGIDVTVTLDADNTTDPENPKGYIATTGEQTYTVTLALKDVKANGGDPTPDDRNAINALAAAYIGVIANPTQSKVSKYLGGIAYYSTRIQHFGDTETPWNAPTEAYNVYQHATNPCVYPANGTQTIGGTTTIYGTDHANAWLGRWGIVRNNWYLLTLKKIEGIGSPVPEDFNGTAGNTPDDNPKPKYYIAAEIHILPWVKRTQEVVF